MHDIMSLIWVQGAFEIMDLNEMGVEIFTFKCGATVHRATTIGPFTSCLKDVRPSTAMTVGWPFTGSAFTLEIRK